MLVLFDHGTPAPLLPFIKSHTVKVAKAQGWDRLTNGALLTAAENAGFEVLITPDKRIRYQQNLTGRRIAIVVIGHAQWPVVRHYVELVIKAVDAATPGSYSEVHIPYRP